MVMSRQVSIDTPKDLSGSDLQELFEFFCSAFRAEKRGFLEDLNEKEKILRIRKGSHLAAFSTLRTYRPQADIRLVFSGDTFVHPEERIGHRLPALWARYVYGEMPPIEGVRDYWLLLCSGYRTYRILPTFFTSFAPGLSTEPPLLALRDQFASHLFAHRFQKGVVRPQWATPLKEPEPPARLLQDPHVRFFLEQNPGYHRGEELVCLAPLCQENLTSAGRRLALTR